MWRLRTHVHACVCACVCVCSQPHFSIKYMPTDKWEVFSTNLEAESSALVPTFLALGEFLEVTEASESSPWPSSPDLT